MFDHVTIVEVGPRDGLQNEPKTIGLDEKVNLINLLSTSGLKQIEVGSFVNPKIVPQMADSGLVFSKITRRPDVSYSALVPNLNGYEQAKKYVPDAIAIFCSASESFSKANLNASIDESFKRISQFISLAEQDGILVRGYVSCVTDCPFEGPVPASNVAKVVAKLREFNCYEISLGDTLGKGSPETIDKMIDNVLNEVSVEILAGHFHDTSGLALKNIQVSLERGIRVFDTAVGGLGGCPFAPGAPGNVATESVLEYVQAKGFKTGVDMKVIMQAAKLVRDMRHV
jgi:hydroxymethylglutaryl-CoA lyase